MVTSKVSYLGDLRTSCIHVKSGTKIFTDAPTDNNGKGEAFSPTDLVATSYASCMLTIIGIYCNNNGYKFENGTAEVTKVMESNPRRISELNINLDLSGNDWDEKTQQKVIKAANACPVAITLGDNVKTKLNYTF